MQRLARPDLSPVFRLLGRRHRRAVAGAALAAGVALILAIKSGGHQRQQLSSAPLQQEAYVWQRNWTPQVRAAIVRASRGDSSSSSPLFCSLTPLAAQVQWRSAHDPPQLIRVPINYEVLKAAGHTSVSLALRIGSYGGSFAPDDAVARMLGDLAVAITHDAASHGITPSEIQIDFDCATQNLAGYRVWVEMLQRRLAPVPIAITALPAWLPDANFAALARAAGRYVLQVHSLSPPPDIHSPLCICDPSAACRAVERAGEIGVPFRVALPTYGYIVAFNGAGQFTALSAEGPATHWPADAQLRTARADPQQLARLVQRWSHSHPSSMTRIIWYRLPVDSDELNWSWPTLLSVAQGRCPQPNVVAHVIPHDGPLDDIAVTNEGSAPAPLPHVRVRWSGGSLVASDALGGFTANAAEAGALRLCPIEIDSSNQTPVLDCGETRLVGWLRLSVQGEVTADVENVSQP